MGLRPSRKLLIVQYSERDRTSLSPHSTCFCPALTVLGRESNTHLLTYSISHACKLHHPSPPCFSFSALPKTAPSTQQTLCKNSWSKGMEQEGNTQLTTSSGSSSYPFSPAQSPPLECSMWSYLFSRSPSEAHITSLKTPHRVSGSPRFLPALFLLARSQPEPL